MAHRLRESPAKDGLAGRVRWAGVVREMRILHAAADAGLNLSDFEGMSNSIMECMARGIVVVATRTGGSTQSIRNVQEGYLVDCGDAEGAA